MAAADLARLIPGYKKILNRLVEANSDDDIEELFRELEKLPDDTSDLEERFSSREGRNLPLHWLAMMRILRFSISLRIAMQERYEIFVSSYETLGAKQQKSRDEKRLMEEIGKILYQADDLSGRHERLAHGLLATIGQRLNEIHGREEDAREELYRGEMVGDAIAEINPLLLDLYEICRSYEQLERVMAALDRIRRRIVATTPNAPKDDA